jgi:GNAT superfamily N-acetyltransferase
MEVRRESYGSEAAQRLTRALADELLGRYEGSGGVGPEPAASDFEPPDGAFLVGYEEDAAVACGGVCRYDGRTAEIRRMYVVPERRGHGLSRAILAELEEEARSLGYEVVWLETGTRQLEAVGLYRSAGYEPIARYGPYVDDERSVCFEKRL